MFRYVRVLVFLLFASAPAVPAQDALTFRKRRASNTTRLKEAGTLIKERQFVTAGSKLDALISQRPREPQARFLKGVVETELGHTDVAIEVFRGLIADYPELPEPYNNLAVIYAQKGEYDSARIALETAVRTAPNWSVARENLGDIYARLAAAEYDRPRSSIATTRPRRLSSPLCAVCSRSTPARSLVSSLRPFILRGANPMFRRPFLIAVTAAAPGFALPARRQPDVEFDTTQARSSSSLSDAAPKTVANFLDYVKAKHYDGTQFHRVIGGFMIQGGGFTPDFKEKPTRPPVPIESEQSSKAGFLNRPYTLAMARTSDPNSASAQFFINVADNKFLNFREATQQGYGYTVFGKVISGMDVVDKIAKAPTGAGGPFQKDVPAEKVVINKAVVVDAK
jgi:cyclophilin family peptidyl-prolyl cis-trans isomerase/Tfp pilus assembly protein PilF